MSVTSFLDQNSALVCERYREEARQAGSKPALASMLDVNVCEWLCMMQPNHDSCRWLTEHLANYINGRWAKDCGGYTCSVYAGYDGEIELRDTVTAIIGCNAKVKVPDNAFVKVFASDSRITLKDFGKNARLSVESNGTTEVLSPENKTYNVERKELKTL